MANSRDFIEPKAPRDPSTLTRSWKSPSGVNWQPGRILVWDNSAGEAALCDPGDTSTSNNHEVAPVGILWVDLETRSQFDAAGTDLSGNDYLRADVFIHSFTAKVNVSKAFHTNTELAPEINSPAEGDYVLKNYDASDGSMIAHSKADVETILGQSDPRPFDTASFPGMQIGRVVKTADSDGFATIRFDID